ncbi:hypothetical protein BK022_03540 [Methylorubrum extorquens]|uniref:Uncharacterized protein n=1 Tax=Methylorubrum extorquens TaxID=408 RepID=A0A1S1P442_METEX|nr:hypothetical protein BK022_03540 [Methylorubrum extorquens]
MAKSATPIVPVLVHRSYVLVDPTRHPEPQLTGIQWARREKVVDPTILGVSDPTPLWFVEAGLAIPSADALAAFARHGILLLQQAPVGMMPYRVRAWADIAVDAAIATAEQNYDGQAEDARVSSKAERDRIRAAAVLTSLDGLTPDVRSNAFVEAFGRSPAGRTSLIPFTQLQQDHPDLLAEALDRSWTDRRTKLERSAAIEAPMRDIRPSQHPAQVDRWPILRSIWSRLLQYVPRR